MTWLKPQTVKCPQWEIFISLGTSTSQKPMQGDPDVIEIDWNPLQICFVIWKWNERQKGWKVLIKRANKDLSDISVNSPECLLHILGQ